MANFNAGAIEASLTLDRSSFRKELKAAQEQARRFEQRGINLDLHIDATELLELDARLERLNQEAINIAFDIDGQEDLLALTREIDELDGRTIDINVDIDNATAEFAALSREIEAMDGRDIDIDVDVDQDGRGIAGVQGFNEKISRMEAIILAVLAIAPLVGPAIAGAAAGVGALASALTIAGLGVGAFALAAIPVFSELKDAVGLAAGDINQLPPDLREAGAAIFAFNDTLTALKAATRDGVLKVFAAAARAANDAIRPLAPVINAVSAALIPLIDQFDAFAKSAQFQDVIDFIATNVGPVLTSLIKILANVVVGFGGMVNAFMPFTTTFLGGLESLTAKFAEWGTTLDQNQQFQTFLAFVQETGPKVVELIGNIVRAFINLMRALAPLSGPLLDGLNHVFDFIADMDPGLLGAIVIGLGALYIAFQAIAAIMFVVNTIMAANVFVLVAVAVIALVAVIITLWKTNEGFRDVVLAVWGAIQTAVGAVVSFFTDTVAPAFVAVWNAIVTGLQAVGSFFTAVWGAITTIVSTAWTIISTIVSTYLTIIATIITTYFNIYKTIITTVVNAILALWRAWWGLFGGVITAVFKLIVQVAKLGMALTALVIGSALKLIGTIWSTAWNAIKAVVNGVWITIRTIVTNGVNLVRDYVVNQFNVLKGAVNTVWNAISGIISKIWGVIGPAVRAGVNAVKSLVSDAWNAVKTATSTVWNTLSGIVGKALGAVGRTVSAGAKAIRDAFSGAGSWLYNAGRDIIQGLLNGIESLINSVTSKLKSLTDKIPKIKGPEERDKRLLEPAGRWIMEGLLAGLDKGIPEVLNRLSDLTDEVGLAINPAITTINPEPGMQPSLTPGVAGAATAEDLIRAIEELGQRILETQGPLIGEYNEARESASEIAEKFWFLTKTRG